MRESDLGRRGRRPHARRRGARRGDRRRDDRAHRRARRLRRMRARAFPDPRAGIVDRFSPSLMGRSPSPADEFRRSLAVEGCNVLFGVVGLSGIRNGVRARHRMGRRNGPSSSMNRACFRLPDEKWRIVAAFGPSLASFKRPRWLVFVDAKSPSGVALRLNVRLRRFEIITAVKNEIHSSWSLKLAA